MMELLLVTGKLDAATPVWLGTARYAVWEKAPAQLDTWLVTVSAENVSAFRGLAHACGGVTVAPV